MLFGPFQTAGLLLSGWTIAPTWDYDAVAVKYHILPQLQIYDNFLGAPALALFTWLLYIAYTRGHLTEALTDLITSFQSATAKDKTSVNLGNERAKFRPSALSKILRYRSE